MVSSDAPLLSETAEHLFESAWASGLLSGLPWGVLADRLLEDGCGDAARRAAAVRNFDPAAVDWSGFRDRAHAITALAAFAAVDGQAALLAAVLFQEVVAVKYAAAAWRTPAVATARRIGLRLALGLPVAWADRSDACDAANRAAYGVSEFATRVVVFAPAWSAFLSVARSDTQLSVQSAVQCAAQCVPTSAARYAAESAARSVLDQVVASTAAT